MTDRYLSSSWSIEVPPAWTIEEADECVGLVPEDEQSALQISAYTKDGAEISLDDMRRFARDGAPGREDPVPIRCGDFQGFTRAYVEDERAWRAWWLAAGPHHLYVTWNTELAEAEAHRDLVDRLMATLRLQGGAA